MSWVLHRQFAGDVGIPVALLTCLALAWATLAIAARLTGKVKRPENWRLNVLALAVLAAFLVQVAISNRSGPRHSLVVWVWALLAPVGAVLLLSIIWIVTLERPQRVSWSTLSTRQRLLAAAIALGMFGSSVILVILVTIPRL